MNDVVCFEYVNHRGLAATRRVRPIRIWFGSTAWYPSPQWLLEAWDVDKSATRDFALAKISAWRIAP
jgi:predicted DNA-binding transcriptional regulator YafY